jgi:inhibitor of growth protein 3
MSKVMTGHMDQMAGPSSLRGGSSKNVGSHGASGSVNGGASISGNLPPWTQEQPTPEELTLYTTLSAYADALDALPLDLTRSFSDLRELDAVLGPHLNSLTHRLDQLTSIIEDHSFTPGERLLALKEVAEEARAYKMGGEDKIRVALNTAETIISHTTYIDSLLANLSSVPSLASILSPAKHSHLAGHLSDGTALAPGSGPGGNNPANMDTSVDNVSPTKKKRAGQAAGQTQGATSTLSTAAEKRANEAATQATANAAAKKRKQAAQAAAAKARAAKEAAEDTDGDISAPSAKRPGVKRSNKANGGHDRDDEKDSENPYTTSGSRSRGARARTTQIRESGSDNEEDGSDTGSTAPRSARVARAPRPAHAADNEPVNAALSVGDDADERRYCFCNNVSYGDMIGCDGDDCEREWFHLGCVGLLKPPQGTWYCDDCAQKRSTNARNKKQKTKLAKTSGAHGGGVVETKTRTASGKR